MNMVKSCLLDDPGSRPSVRKIISAYKRIFGERQQNMAELLFGRLQSYGDTLEVAVQERLADLKKQKLYVDELLTQVMPPYVFTAPPCHCVKGKVRCFQYHCEAASCRRSCPSRAIRERHCLFHSLRRFSGLCLHRVAVRHRGFS